MAEVKVVIGDKVGKSFQKTIESSEHLLGRKIGESFKGDLIGVSGYEFLITGGSDDSGFPMRKGIKTGRRARILAHSGVGVKVKVKGKLIRKTVASEVIHEKTNQINVKVSKEGAKKLEELFGKTKEGEINEKKVQN